MKLSILDSFSSFTGLRYCSISDNSGEEFYHEKLNEFFYQSISNGEKLIIDLDNTAGYSPSFIDEAFGNLVFDYSKSLVEENLVIISNQEPHWIEMINKETIIDWENRRINKQSPKKTKNHSPWYRKINNGQFEKKLWLSV